MRLLLIVAVLAVPHSAWGVSPDIFLRASSHSGVPVELLLAVSHVESRFNAYALNVSGRSFYPSSHAEAERILNDSSDSVDVGLMQVNWGIWGRKLGYSKANLLNPTLNVLLGAGILGYYVRLERDWWKGVGRYHSSMAWRQRNYINKVWESYKGILSRVRR